jgi:hypothetical protein
VGGPEGASFLEAALPSSLAAAYRPGRSLQVPGRGSGGGPESAVRVGQESTALAVLVVLLARAAVSLTFSILPGLVVGDGAGVGMDRGVVVVTVVIGDMVGSLLVWTWSSWHPDSWGWGRLAPGHDGVVATWRSSHGRRDAASGPQQERSAWGTLLFCLH